MTEGKLENSQMWKLNTILKTNSGMSIMGKFRETEDRLVVARGYLGSPGKKGLGE